MRVNGRSLAVSAVLLGVLAPPQPARYRAAQLACAVYAEVIQSSVRGQSGETTVGDRVYRAGVVVVRARSRGDSLVVEAWYDSLSVVRTTEAGKETAETDGFVGGRYRGVLAADGRYQAVTIPFVPDELAAQVELASALDEFLPRLAPDGLQVGREWNDGHGFSIKRQDDTRDRPGLIEHYSWAETRRAGETVDAGDSVAVRLDQVIKERGDVAWSDKFGPLSWTRHLTVNARIPATGGIKHGIHSTVEQEISVIRRFDLESACGQPSTGN